MKIAVIGAGISGLEAAHALSGSHEVHVFEKEARPGGHTNTVQLPDGTPVDTGFIVHTRQNYPTFVRLMEELGVPTAPSDMSFAYAGPELSWCSRGLNGVLTDRRYLFSPRFWRFWREVRRFNTWGTRQALAATRPELTLQEALDEAGFSDDLRQAYLYPMAGAVWSTPLGDMGAFPALALLRFFHHHGMLGFATQRPWRTIPGGTSRYLEPLCRSFRSNLHVSATIQDVRRDPGGVSLHLKGEGRLNFDQIIFACHGDQVLPLLADADPLEQDILASFQTNASPTWLHSDTSLLPPRRRAWASWNCRKVPDGRLLLTYHMNRLQPLATRQDVLVTLHGEGHVDEARVFQKFNYEHPRFDLAAIRAQARWAEISGRRRVHFAGAYWLNGFHEDGLVSGLRVAETLRSIA
jgi:predicted NAD/FAD-binding protein